MKDFTRSGFFSFATGQSSLLILMNEKIEFTAILKKEADSPMLHVDFPFDMLLGGKKNPSDK
ncbi:MAG: hypothetical protein DYG98_25235 [Haliscomenobacteraceae bacterium CHB4]|nr:hypothetical protein [Haliscomenobacteraceae bacterium CHB4]